jgi:hypothetical protein
VGERANATKMINSEREKEHLLIHEIVKHSNPRVGARNRELLRLITLMLRGSGCRCKRGISSRGRRWRDGNIDGKEPGSLRRRFREVGGRKVHANVGGAFAKARRRELRGFNGDAVGGGSKGGKGGEDTEESCESVAEGITESTFMDMGAGKDVVTKGIKGFATRTDGVVEFRRKERQAKTAEKGKAVDVVVVTVVFVLA